MERDGKVQVVASRVVAYSDSPATSVVHFDVSQTRNEPSSCDIASPQPRFRDLRSLTLPQTHNSVRSPQATRTQLSFLGASSPTPRAICLALAPYTGISVRPFYTRTTKFKRNDPTITRRHGGTTLVPLEVNPENPNTSNCGVLGRLRNDSAKDTVIPKRCQSLFLWIRNDRQRSFNT